MKIIVKNYESKVIVHSYMYIFITLDSYGYRYSYLSTVSSAIVQ